MWKARLALVGLGIVLAFAVGISGGYFASRIMAPPASTPITTTSTILQQVQSMSQLVTVKYVLEKVVILEDVKWYGESRVLLVAHGIVKAGVDLSRLRAADVQARDGSIRIDLPGAEITDAYLDEQKTQVIERTTGLLRMFDKDLEQEARRQAIDEIRLAARQGGILNDATERARWVLSVLLRESGKAEVEFREQAPRRSKER